MAFPELWPTESAASLPAAETAAIRGTTIAGCILTDAEIDAIAEKVVTNVTRATGGVLRR